MVRLQYVIFKATIMGLCLRQSTIQYGVAIYTDAVQFVKEKVQHSDKRTILSSGVFVTNHCRKVIIYRNVCVPCWQVQSNWIRCLQFPKFPVLEPGVLRQ